eukprot:2778667-Rhodomonas_salina.1
MACSACKVGKYKPANRPAQCETCRAGSYQNLNASSVCMACPADSNSLPGSQSVEECVDAVFQQAVCPWGDVDQAYCFASHFP